MAKSFREREAENAAESPELLELIDDLKVKLTEMKDELAIATVSGAKDHPPWKRKPIPEDQIQSLFELLLQH